MLNFKRLVVIAACLASVGASSIAWGSGSTARTRTQQLIIELDSSTSQRQAQSTGSNQTAINLNLPDGRQVKVLRSFFNNSLVVELPEEISLEEADRIATEMALRAGVISVQPNKRFYPALTPNDPSYPAGSGPLPSLGQWYLFDAIAGIRMPAAWDISTGSSNVIIAVLDTGIIDHRDLDPARVLPGYDFFSNSGQDNDGIPGRDNNPDDPGDAVNAGDCGPGEPAKNSSWHGLSVAGVAVATSNNSMVIAGIDFSAQLLPVRVLGRCGGELSDVADAIRWAAGLPVINVPANLNPANVINLSLSGTGACSSVEQDAINAAVAAGSVIVVAAGNDDGTNIVNISPANCANVIVVGAIAKDGKLAAYANVGLAVDLTAPGGDTPVPGDPANPSNGILVLSNDGTTVPGADALDVVQGTSFTTPQVSAVSSLILALDSTLTPAEVEVIIKATTRGFPDASCDQAQCGTGVLDAVAALSVALNPGTIVADQPPLASVGGPYIANSGVPIIFDGFGSFDPDGGSLTYAWDFGDGSFGSGVAPSHTYSTAGTNTVLLIVSDGVKESAIAVTTATVDGGGQTTNTAGGGGGGGGGGGCTLVAARVGKTDALWWLMLAVFVGRLSRRSASHAKRAT
ncbi:hypothetical protein MNBD_GAMMA13-974 [hydrothermal vent metagenome]|uniref:PKD domain-containing protein n=1 Tax=hydrothermal vent metagenome TaxID=652676 RepID=A0A3B0YJ31_9ZZZZ